MTACMHCIQDTWGTNSTSAMLENSCAWCQLDMPAYSRNFSLLYVSYALKLGVWLSFVSFLIHRSQKTSLISIIVMHIAEQCLYHHSPWNDSVEICYFRKKNTLILLAFTFQVARRNMCCHMNQSINKKVCRFCSV